MQISKIDAHTIVVTKTEMVDTTSTYEVGFLRQQRERVQTQKDQDNKKRDAELAEIDTLLAEAEKLGVTAKPETDAAAVVVAPPA